jgi:hypothetical protein
MLIGLCEFSRNREFREMLMRNRIVVYARKPEA